MKRRVCGMPVGKAKNGVDRGTCTLEIGHGGGRHASKTCSHCGIEFTIKTASSTPKGVCRQCRREYNRQHKGQTPRNYQTPGEHHVFPCGCSGVLPRKRGESNQFAIWTEHGSKSASCRVLFILLGSKRTAVSGNHRPIDPNTPHSVIRAMMKDKDCIICHKPLKWEFGPGKTPHLHHDHITGEIHGFAHSVCNPAAMQNRIFELEAEVKLLKAA